MIRKTRPETRILNSPPYTPSTDSTNRIWRITSSSEPASLTGSVVGWSRMPG